MNTDDSPAARAAPHQKPPLDYQHLQQQLKFERLISGIAARLIDLPAPEIDATLRDSLRQIGEFFGADQLSLNELLSDTPLQWPSPSRYTPEMADRLKFIGQLLTNALNQQRSRDGLQTEHKLQYRVAFDALVSEISTDLILLEADKIDPGIEIALGKIARFVGAEAGYVFLIAPDKTSYWLEYLWQTDGGVMDKTRLRHLDINDLPYFGQRRRQKLPVVVSSPDDLPPEATAERQLYAQIGYKSALEVPMLWQDDVIGFVGLYCLHQTHAWNSDDVQLLTIVGQMITHARQRQQAEQKLRQELNFHNAIIQNAASGLAVCHQISVFPFSRFTEWNRKMVEITGYTLDDINRLGWYQTLYTDPAEKERAETRARAMRQGDDLQAEEWAITRADGQHRLVSISTTGFPSADGTLHTLTLLQDITVQNQLATEKQALEAQLRRSQRLDTIGTLAGGIAHDFNNLLMPIIGFAELAELRLPENHPVNHYLQQIGEAANRAKDLVQQILTFSRQMEQERQPVQIAPIIEEVVRLLRPMLPPTISIRQQVAANCDSVLGEPTQIQQIIMNLCTNAFQAMQETGGMLTLSLEQLSRDEVAGYAQPKLEAKSYIKLIVSDTGEGMDAYTRDRIFEPFFTTRKVGQGSGLGMSVVHGLVKNYQGAVHINSEPGQGTDVAIFLPAVRPQPLPPTANNAPLKTGSVTILLVDDDETVAEVTSEMLSQLGYEVKKATSSVEALTWFAANAANINLVITDLTMPDFNGAELAVEIAKIRPDIPIILTTGYSEKAVTDFSGQHNIVTVLRKPIGFSLLGKTVAQTLTR